MDCPWPCAMPFYPTEFEAMRSSLQSSSSPLSGRQIGQQVPSFVPSFVQQVPCATIPSPTDYRDPVKATPSPFHITAICSRAIITGNKQYILSAI
ncbi:unnamed protein product [Cercopithifilaria johnstoni]|uniref:Uncharacterized protein n=1 Tax=Cercopithifilaria johnstoni TaxID=2874296 RepID=A0A8J2MQI7_9BILA|nr:unnamed protein product [Cercopithifilaria johnstoni]